MSDDNNNTEEPAVVPAEDGSIGLTKLGTKKYPQGEHPNFLAARKKGRQPTFNKKLKKHYLSLLPENQFNQAKCAREIGLSINTINAHKKKDSDFKEAFDEVMSRMEDDITAEIFRRGHDGVLKDVYYQGTVVGQERQYDSSLLLAIAKAKIPEFGVSTTNINLEANVTNTDAGSSKEKLLSLLDIDLDMLDGEFDDITDQATIEQDKE